MKLQETSPTNADSARRHSENDVVSFKDQSTGGGGSNKSQNSSWYISNGSGISIPGVIKQSVSLDLCC